MATAIFPALILVLSSVLVVSGQYYPAYTSSYYRSPYATRYSGGLGGGLGGGVGGGYHGGYPYYSQNYYTNPGRYYNSFSQWNPASLGYQGGYNGGYQGGYSGFGGGFSGYQQQGYPYSGISYGFGNYLKK